MKFDLPTIDFDKIDVRDVKYLPPSFDGDILFNFPPINKNIYSIYGRSMDDIDKMCDGHSWCIKKATNIQNNYTLF